jgi:serine/threonine protein kinase
MTSERYQRVKEVFLAVCDKAEDQQDGEAVRLCAGDTELLAEVNSLLKSHREAQVESAKPNATETLLETEEEVEESQTTEADPPAVSQEIRPSRSPSTGHRSSLKSAISQHRSHVSRTGSSHRDSMDSTPRGRFDPGTILADRYRIVSLLGIGGMGEVYRAEDLTLDQPVALKFLPQSFENNQTWLERFHNEVRLSRQVTHANVCRVFDIGEIDDEQFISMEFVDGEDLSALLRRIGRLPKDKAIQIARQLCAGLAAAHDKGVLHRDLKPANIMLDGRGQVRITDFGISGRVDGAPEAAAGTPAYMAPEQFTKGEATVRSDIYSLGLVLYEIFTGRQAFTAHSMPEYARMHRLTSPTHPSTFIEDMDPIAERAILRCLEKDPSKRPGSALAVAAALPGGDPLAAMLAAGETPSPQMVAAAGSAEGFNTIRAGILLGLTLIGVVAVVLLAARSTPVPRMRDGIKAPEVLTDRALQILTDAGYADSPLRSRADGFGLDEQYIGWVHDVDHSAGRWDRLATARPGAIYFWYRQSPSYLVSKDDIGMVTLDEPARSVPGMRTIVLDSLGRLRKFEVLPDAALNKSSPASLTMTAADFAPLFQAAELKEPDFKAVPPSEIPPMYVTSRFAWDGVYPEDQTQHIHIEAAGFGNRPVYFNIRESWQDDADQRGIAANPELPIGRNVSLQTTLILAALVSSLILAWRNIRSGQVDSEGAQRLSGLFVSLGLLIWILCSNHVPEFFLEMRSFFRVLGFILVPAVVVWMFYLALEPYVRKTWPETVISWSRALAGRLTDPLVASHVLAGLAVGVAAALLAELTNILPMYFGHAAAVPNLSTLVRFFAKENPTSVALWALLDAFYIGLLYLLAMVLFLLVMRRKWIAGAVLVLMGSFNNFQWYSAGWVQWTQAGLVMCLILLLLVRYGLVATIAGLWCMYFLRFLPITPDTSQWYFNQTRYAVGLIIVIAVAAATLATGRWRIKTSSNR